MKKTVAVVLFFISTLSILSFQNCGGKIRPYGETEVVSLSEKCNLALFEEYKTTYHPYFQQIGCKNCHTQGGQRQASPFASPDADLGFNIFKRYGPNAIYSKIKLESHQKVNLNYDLTKTLEDLGNFRDAWKDVEISCSQTSLSLTTDTQKNSFFDPSKVNLATPNDCFLNDPLKSEVVAAPFSLTHVKPDTLSWDLGKFRSDLSGTTVAIEVSVFKALPASLCPVDGYLVGNVKISTAKKLKLSGLKIFINGNDFDVNTFNVVRTVPAGSSNFLLLGDGAAFSLYNTSEISAANEWSLFITNIEVIN